jgi:hypothetical protein
MTKYTGAVTDAIEEPGSFNALIYPVYGIRLGKMKNIWFNLEAHAPAFCVGKKVHPFICSNAGMGLQLSVQIPLNHYEKI